MKVPKSIPYDEQLRKLGLFSLEKSHKHLTDLSNPLKGVVVGWGSVSSDMPQVKGWEEIALRYAIGGLDYISGKKNSLKE